MLEVQEHVAGRELNLVGRDRIHVLVKPNARKTEILSYDEATDTYTVAIKAPPQDGKANAELERFMSKLAREPFVVKVGKTSKRKIMTARRTPQRSRL